MIDFRSLETFLWVANLRSFRGAADRLHTTQPAVSMRIAQLEDDLGVRLLDRDRRAVSPTEKGQLLLRYADRLIRQRAEMIEAVGDRITMRGIVRLGVSETIVHTWLPTLIERVNTAYPNLEMEIEVDISPNLRDRLVAKDSNLALLLGPISDPNVHSQPLCSYPSRSSPQKKSNLARKSSRSMKLRNGRSLPSLEIHSPSYSFMNSSSDWHAYDNPCERLALDCSANGARWNRDRRHTACDLAQRRRRQAFTAAQDRYHASETQLCRKLALDPGQFRGSKSR